MPAPRYGSIRDRPNTKLGNMFESARRALGLSQNEVARRTATDERGPISASTWAVLVKGGRYIGGRWTKVSSSEEVIRRVATVLEVDVDHALRLAGYQVAGPGAPKADLAGVPTAVLQAELARREQLAEVSDPSATRRPRTNTGTS